MDATRWKVLSQLLDQLLEMEPSHRQQRLDHLGRDDPALALALHELLATEHEATSFLAEPCWTPPDESARAGALFGAYRLLRRLGEGGMGEVWLAERADGLYQRRVALKLLRAGYADPGLYQRFSQERQILARLEHPHLARLLDAGVGEGGQPYLALAYVEGEPITDYCQRLRLPVEARLRLIMQVCAAVSHAHANLVVHRDLKPSNILVTAEGEVCLLDFGIAKLLDTEGPANPQALPEARAFTLHYAAPEQVRGEAITTLTDVYSLGVVLYEVLTDQKPYRLRRHSDAEWETAILGVEPPLPSLAVVRTATQDTLPHARRLAWRLRGDLDSILTKALQKVPARRYASAEALGLDLQRHLQDHPVQARPARPLYRLHKYLRRYRWAAAMASIAVLALLATSATALWQARQARVEMARAQTLQNFVVGLFDVAGNIPRGDFDIHRLLEAGERRGQDELGQQPLAQAELAGVIARLRIGLGDYRQALGLLEKQQRLLVTQSQVPKGLRLEAVTQHGRALRMLGQSSQCIKLMAPLTAMAIEQQAALPRHAANFYSQLGRCERMGGSTLQARRWLQRSLALRRDVLGDAIGAIENMTDLAGLEGDAGHSAAAVAGYRQALVLLRQQGGERHPVMINLQRSLATAYRELGDTVSAEQQLRAARADAEQVHGPRHPETLAIRRLLAAVLIDQGQLIQAERELRQAHALTVQTLGPQHRETGLSWDALGKLALEQGRLDEAVADAGKSVQVWRQPDSLRLLPYGLGNYGRLLLLAGRPAEALTALREARRLRVAQLGPDDGAVVDIDLQIAEVLAAQGQAQDAAGLLDRAIARAQHHYAPDHPRMRAMRLAQARHMGRMGHREEALQQLETLASGDAGELGNRKLRWLARSYAAELRCRQGAAAALQELRGVQREVTAAMPEGGSLSREIGALQAGCEDSRRLAAR
ncbi:serine/threonine-protein kinase [Stenotrophomonas sp. YIM B06876]|uniref:serine/threonine-protein kinase n=1 Tax=Stenotrophomonas sp. YIM B06876 TaxID=3060211 RepID=UPI002738B46E|nr:serine/threonine-protein kinase [Stenotrophomonas sp. YIM B06876]